MNIFKNKSNTEERSTFKLSLRKAKIETIIKTNKSKANTYEESISFYDYLHQINSQQSINESQIENIQSIDKSLFLLNNQINIKAITESLIDINSSITLRKYSLFLIKSNIDYFFKSNHKHTLHIPYSHTDDNTIYHVLDILISMLNNKYELLDIMTNIVLIFITLLSDSDIGNEYKDYILLEEKQLLTKVIYLYKDYSFTSLSVLFLHLILRIVYIKERVSIESIINNELPFLFLIKENLIKSKEEILIERTMKILQSIIDYLSNDYVVELFSDLIPTLCDFLIISNVEIRKCVRTIFYEVVLKITQRSNGIDNPYTHINQLSSSDHVNYIDNVTNIVINNEKDKEIFMIYQVNNASLSVSFNEFRLLYSLFDCNFIYNIINTFPYNTSLNDKKRVLSAIEILLNYIYLFDIQLVKKLLNNIDLTLKELSYEYMINKQMNSQINTNNNNDDHVFLIKKVLNILSMLILESSSLTSSETILNKHFIHRTSILFHIKTYSEALESMMILLILSYFIEYLLEKIRISRLDVLKAGYVDMFIRVLHKLKDNQSNLMSEDYLNLVKTIFLIVNHYFISLDEKYIDCFLIDKGFDCELISFYKEYFEYYKANDCCVVCEKMKERLSRI